MAGGDNCTGFAFSDEDPQHCLIYMNTNVAGLNTTMATGQLHHDAAQLRPIPAVAKLRANNTVETLVWDLFREVSASGMAVRRRLTSLTPGCHKPLDWIELANADGKTPMGGSGAVVSLNHTMFELLVQSLPVIEGGGDVGRSMSTTIGTDRVCIDIDSHGCIPAQEVMWGAVARPTIVGIACLIVGFVLGRWRSPVKEKEQYLQIQITDQPTANAKTGLW
eukprot:CAMPEP_0179190940 /NCGR_PEP_ID=MMETSP0796-20121207/94827_1 /TAXON_ID=73915 /ORGANISM="Pyrodinium bahamense, Strain pbaha01" /LENGTH=220 /DNA_ID=CAMNT_0020895143 /DNA_START=6 /DNA_END=666 /DNA_ORIENTATION=-